MIGQQSVSISIYICGLLFIVFVITGPTQWIPRILLIVGVIFTLMSICWINYYVSKNNLKPLIDRINPETEEVWVRITKSKLLTFQVVKKGVYGQTKGMAQGKKSDVIDHGDFPIRLINGNSAILTYDEMGRNVNLDHAVAWKQLFKEQKVNTAEEAYNKAKKVVADATS